MLETIPRDLDRCFFRGRTPYLPAGFTTQNVISFHLLVPVLLPKLKELQIRGRREEAHIRSVGGAIVAGLGCRVAGARAQVVMCIT